MRYAERITFVSQVESYYDPRKSEWVESEPIKVTKPCKLSALGINRQSQLFGDLQAELQVARLQVPYNQSFNYVEIDDKRYKVKQRSDYRRGVLFLGRDNLAD